MDLDHIEQLAFNGDKPALAYLLTLAQHYAAVGEAPAAVRTALTYEVSKRNAQKVQVTEMVEQLWLAGAPLSYAKDRGAYDIAGKEYHFPPRTVRDYCDRYSPDIHDTIINGVDIVKRGEISPKSTSQDSSK